MICIVCGHSNIQHAQGGPCTVMPYYPSSMEVCSCTGIESPSSEPKTDTVNHPSHYGGIDDPYEAIKVIEAWNLGFNLGNAVKYICRAGNKGPALDDLKKAAWYINREIKNMEKK